MIELRVSGATVQEIIEQGAGFLAVLAQGAGALQAFTTTPHQEMPGEPAPEQPAAPRPETAPIAAGGTGESPAAGTKRRGRFAKKTETVTPEPELNDSLDDLTAKAPKTYTLDDDVRPRLRTIVSKRRDELVKQLPAEEHKNIEQLLTEWVVETVFKRFGISKLSELNAEMFSEFMAFTEQFA